MPSARAVFLFPPSGYNVYTSFSPAERRYTLFECSNVKLYYYQEKARRTLLRAFIAYTVICKHSIRPRKRCMRACCIPSAVYTSERARLSAAVSAAAAIVQAVRPFDLLRLISRSGGQVRRCMVSRSGGACPSQGGFVSVPSVLVPLPVPFCPRLSACSRVVSRKVVKSKVVRES